MDSHDEGMRQQILATATKRDMKWIWRTLGYNIFNKMVEEIRAIDERKAEVLHWCFRDGVMY